MNANVDYQGYDIELTLNVRNPDLIIETSDIDLNNYTLPEIEEVYPLEEK